MKTALLILLFITFAPLAIIAAAIFPAIAPEEWNQAKNEGF